MQGLNHYYHKVFGRKYLAKLTINVFLKLNFFTPPDSLYYLVEKIPPMLNDREGVATYIHIMLWILKTCFSLNAWE